MYIPHDPRIRVVFGARSTGGDGPPLLHHSPERWLMQHSVQEVDFGEEHLDKKIGVWFRGDEVDDCVVCALFVRLEGVGLTGSVEGISKAWVN